MVRVGPPPLPGPVGPWLGLGSPWFAPVLGGRCRPPLVPGGFAWRGRRAVARAVAAVRGPWLRFVPTGAFRFARLGGSGGLRLRGLPAFPVWRVFPGLFVGPIYWLGCLRGYLYV